MVRPSYVRATSRLSNDAPLSTPSTSLSHCSRVAAGNSLANASSSESDMRTLLGTRAGECNEGAIRLVLCGAARGQPLDPGGIDLRRSAADALSGDQAVRHDLGKWGENEGALEQARVRQGEI